MGLRPGTLSSFVCPTDCTKNAHASAEISPGKDSREGAILTPEVHPTADPTDLLRWTAHANSMGQGEVGLRMVTRGANPIVEIDDIEVVSIVLEPKRVLYSPSA